MHINPDHFLQTASGRVFTRERNREAWTESFAALDRTLAQATEQTRLYVMIGAQGSGKTTWARKQVEQDRHSIIFDALLVKRAERAILLTAAKQRNVQAFAVWLQTPLNLCLSRNANRPADEVVPEEAIRNVFSILEVPTQEEGFFQIIKPPFA